MFSKLEIQEILGNSVYTMRLADNSYYITGAGSNAVLEITPPGASCPVIFYVTKGFNTSYNSVSLNLAPNHTYTEASALPDGIYTIRYSIDPNAKIYVEYWLMRNVALLNDFAAEICTLFKNKRGMSTKDFNAKVESLFWIKNLIDACKLMVELQGDRHEGLEMYNEAKALLTRYKKGYSCL